MVKPAA